MRRTRLAAVAAGAGLLLGAGPAGATPQEGTAASDASERDALSLLQAAARAGRELSYTGTQYVATWDGRSSGSALAEVTHDAARGSRVRADRPLAATAVLDPRLLSLLASTYDLRVSGPGTCTGRSARVVEATRPDGTVAGRFWVDRASGLLLRREVFDERGDRLRSSAFVDLAVAAAPEREGSAATVSSSAWTSAGLPDAAAVDALRERGWRVPTALPGGLRLFDTEVTTPRPGRHVLHLAYSDGLSTLSLFEQRGRLGTAPVPGFTAETIGDRPVWVHHDSPERVVWSGAGRVWTLVSDAPARDVRDAVEALPRDAAPRDGVTARLGRGLTRLGGLLNPFS